VVKHTGSFRTKNIFDSHNVSSYFDQICVGKFKTGSSVGHGHSCLSSQLLGRQRWGGLRFKAKS
jgi:hypothetical protein